MSIQAATEASFPRNTRARTFDRCWMFAYRVRFYQVLSLKGAGSLRFLQAASLRVRAFDLKIRVVARFENPLEKLEIKSKSRSSGPNAHQAVERISLKTIDFTSRHPAFYPIDSQNESSASVRLTRAGCTHSGLICNLRRATELDRLVDFAVPVL